MIQELVNPVKDKVNSEKVNAEFAMDEVASMFISMFENMDNEYMKERAADIRDVTKRVLAHLLGINFSNPGTISEEVIIIAEDLTPSDTAQLNHKYAKVSLLISVDVHLTQQLWTRSMEIPAVVGTKVVMEKIKMAISLSLTV